jgi:DNA-binding transcriptional MerR regulator
MPTTAFTISTQQLLRLVEELDRETLKLVTVGVWHREGIASASFPATNGPSSGNHYTLADVARVRLVARLRAAGVSMQKVRVILAQLGDQLPRMLKPGSKAVIVVDGQRGVIVREPGRPDRELPGGQFRLQLSEVVVDEKTAAKFAA